MRRIGVTLVEVFVVVVLAATLVSVLVVPFWPRAQKQANGIGNNEPPAVFGWSLYTRQHDRHWWVIGGEHFVHHPDCPCQRRHAEAVE